MASEPTSRAFLDHIMENGEVFENKEQKDRFIANYANGDKTTEKAVRTFLKNNFDRTFNPRWALRDNRMLEILNKARRLWKGEAIDQAPEEAEEVEEEPAPSNIAGKRVRIDEVVEIYNPNAPDEEEPPKKKAHVAKKAPARGRKNQPAVEEEAEGLDQNIEEPAVGEGGVVVEQAPAEENNQEEAPPAKTNCKQVKKVSARGEKAQTAVQKGDVNLEDEVAEGMEQEETAVEEKEVEQVPEANEDEAPPKRSSRRRGLGKAQMNEKEEAGDNEEEEVEQNNQEQDELDDTENDAPPKKNTRKPTKGKNAPARGKKNQMVVQDVEEEEADQEEEPPILQREEVEEQEEAAAMPEINEVEVEDVRPKRASRAGKTNTAKGKKAQPVEEEEKAAQEEAVGQEVQQEVLPEEVVVPEEVQQQELAAEEIVENNETANPEDPVIEAVPETPIQRAEAHVVHPADITRLEIKIDEMTETICLQNKLFQQQKDLLQEMFAYIRENQVQNPPPVPPRVPTPYDEIAEQENLPAPLQNVIQVKSENIGNQAGPATRNVRVKTEPISPEVPLSDQLIKPSKIPRAATVRGFK